jgi:hypothetical protein
MPELDMEVVNLELYIDSLLILQGVVAVAAGVLGLVGGWRGGRWWGLGFLLALLLAAVVGGRTLYVCSELRELIQGRLDGRVPGPVADAQRAHYDLAFERNARLAGLLILAGTVTGAGILYGVSRRRRLRRRPPAAGPGPPAV